MRYLQHTRPPSLPFTFQPACAPPVLMCNSSEQGDRKRMEVELLEDTVDDVRSSITAIDTVEGTACGILR